MHPGGFCCYFWLLLYIVALVCTIVVENLVVFNDIAKLLVQLMVVLPFSIVRLSHLNSILLSGTLLSLIVALLWLLAMRWTHQWQHHPQSHLKSPQSPSDYPLPTKHWPVNQGDTETSVQSGHLDAHAPMYTNSDWTCTSIGPVGTSCTPCELFVPWDSWTASFLLSTSMLGAMVVVIITIIIIITIITTRPRPAFSRLGQDGLMGWCSSYG